MPSAIMRFALGGVGEHAARAQRVLRSRRSRRPRTAPGARKRWPSVMLALARPWPSSLAVAQVERHDGAVEQAQDPAQRADPGEGAACRPSASISARGSGAAGPGLLRRSARRPGRPAVLLGRAASSRPPRAAASRAAPCLRRKPASACSGASRCGPRSSAAGGRNLGGHRADPGRSAAGRTERVTSSGASAARASVKQTAEVLGGALPACARDFLAESSESSGMVQARPYAVGLPVDRPTPSGFTRQPGLGAATRQRTHPADIGRALGHADHAARVEQVEQVAGLDALVVGRQRQLCRCSRLAHSRLGIREMP